MKLTLIEIAIECPHIIFAALNKAALNHARLTAKPVVLLGDPRETLEGSHAPLNISLPITPTAERRDSAKSLHSPTPRCHAVEALDPWSVAP